MKYSEIDKRKKAFIFELDDVLYPEKDYLYQVYYLFASLLEYTTHVNAKAVTDTLIDAQQKKGKTFVFDELKEKLGVDEKYRKQLHELMNTAKLPLKLLLFKDALAFLQEIVVDRKQLFIATNGNPIMQLNKIKQTEWHGLEQYLKVYFAEEKRPMPQTDIMEQLFNDNGLQRRDVMMIGNSAEGSLCAANTGIDYVNRVTI